MSSLILMMINYNNNNNNVLAEPAIKQNNERVNCRRVVFHPYCRGISAKRSSAMKEETSNIKTMNTAAVMIESLPKIWQQILMIPDTKYKIIERFNNEQQSIPHTMKAIIIGSSNNNNIDDIENNQFNNDKISTYLIDNDNQNQIKMKKKIKLSTHNDNDELINVNSNEHHLFHIRMIPYPEFVKFFSQIITPPSSYSIITN